MHIYHYSPLLFDTLQTKRKRGVATPEEIQRAKTQAARILQPGALYVDHLSFFFEPIPSEILHLVYGKEHPVWFFGNTLYEYKVDATKIPARSLYEVVESSREVAALDKFVIDNSWFDDDPKLLKKWFVFILAEKIKWGEYGNDHNKLLSQIKRGKGTLEEDFFKAAKRDDFKENFKKYAASVPHLMLYPVGGEVAPIEINQVVIGSRLRTKVDMGIKVYREGDESTFTHMKKTYRVDELIEKTKDIPVTNIELSKLSWMVIGSHPEKDRVNAADTSVPVLVTEYRPGHFVTMDGFHRVAKAIKDGDKTIPMRLVSKDVINKLTVANKK